jgi:hypothetical protein
MKRLVLSLLGLLVAGLATVVEAQTPVGECPVVTTTARRSACPSGHTFADGTCNSTPNWLGHRSHCRLADCGVCRDDETLDAEAGQCLRETSSRVGTPACASGWRFEGGTCQSGPNWLGHRSHCRLEDCNQCRADQILDVAHGLCCDAPR